MNSASYRVRPKAVEAPDSHANYFTAEASPALNHRFLLSAQATFTLLSKQPELGWNPHIRLPNSRGLRFFRVKGFERLLILYRPLPDGVEILRVIHGSQNLRQLLYRKGFRQWNRRHNLSAAPHISR